MNKILKEKEFEKHLDLETVVKLERIAQSILRIKRGWEELQRRIDLPDEDIKITLVDYLNNGRYAYKISGAESKREELRRIKKGDLSISELTAELAEFGVIIIDTKDNYPDYETYYDCRDWAFDKIGLPHHTHREGGEPYKILLRDLPDLKWIGEPEVGAIITYFEPLSDGKSLWIDHWGIVAEVNGEVRINSKWGRGHVYNHPVGMVSSRYPNHVLYCKKV